MSDVSSPKPPLLEVAGLNAFYSGAHVLHDVAFEMGGESVAIIGRNGMGKTTLCAAIMGLTPPRAAGSVKFDGRELLGKPSYKIARAGIGYVPQGRRLFPSLTVDEHLKISADALCERRVDRGSRLRPVSPARRTQAQRRCATVGR